MTRRIGSGRAGDGGWFGVVACNAKIPCPTTGLDLAPILRGDEEGRHPVNPWETGYNERFNGTLRREVLNAECLMTAELAQIVINHLLRQHNHTRPHQALNMPPPVPETLLEKPLISGPETGC